MADIITSTMTFGEDKYIFKDAALHKISAWTERVEAAVNGNKSKYQVGTTFSDPWKDTQSGISYDNPWRVNHYEDCEIEGGDVIPGMWLQNVYASPFGVQFSHPRAFLKCPNGLAAGSYYFTFDENWGSGDKAVAQGDIVCFTLTAAVPEGGRIAGLYGGVDNAHSSWRVYVYDADGKTILETVTPVFVAVDGATNLGAMKLNQRNGDLNGAREMAYGWNRWKYSAIRQYLNSDAVKGAWWTPQDEWDIAPDQLATKDGYLRGLEEELLEILQPVKTITYMNTVNDGGNDDYDVTYDKIIIPSLEQMYINPQHSGEGSSHEYWKNLNGTSTKWAQGGTYDALKQYGVEAKATAQNVRLRSAYRGYAYTTWNIHTSGNVYYGCSASSAIRFEPLVFISNPVIGKKITGTDRKLYSIESSIAEVSGMIASKNYSVGDLVSVNGQLLKVTSAIASGETISSSNSTATSIAELFSSIIDANSISY